MDKLELEFEKGNKEFFSLDELDGLDDAQHKEALDLLMEALNGRVSCDQFNNALKKIRDTK